MAEKPTCTPLTAEEPTDAQPRALPHLRDLLTLDELIDLTGWKKTKTYEDAKAGTLPFPVLRNGRRYYFSRRAYETWRDGETTSDTAA